MSLAWKRTQIAVVTFIMLAVILLLFWRTELDTSLSRPAEYRGSVTTVEENTTTVEENTATVEENTTIDEENTTTDEESATTDEESATTAEAIDQKYCGGPCRFLLPIEIREQESKAQLHFRQLAFLGGHVRRIVVLPNVGGSRLGACQPHEFTHYYSAAWAAGQSQHFAYITMSDFMAWMNERVSLSRPASTQRLFFLGHHGDRSVFEGQADTCLQGRLVKTQPDRSLHIIDSRSGSRLAEASQAAVEFLNFQGTHDIDVLSVYYNVRRKFLPDAAAQHSIPYSEKAKAIADKLIHTHLGSSYLAVHWRTERLEQPSMLVPCASALVRLIKSRTAHSTLDKKPSILLLTDYPHTFSEVQVNKAINGKPDPAAPLIPTSSTFHPDELTPFHHRAIRYLYKHMHVHVTSLEKAPVGALKDWVSITIPSSLSYDDAGFLGIVDKLLAIRANTFLAGAPGECARQSSFTRQIVAARSRLDTSENVIDLFYADLAVARSEE